jgi:molecular chaperone GrpE
VSLPDPDPNPEKDTDLDDLIEQTASAAPDEGTPEDTEGEGGVEAVPEEPGSPDEELEALRRERDELKEALLRRRADFENYRKRVERDRHTAAQDALAAVFREVVATLDNLERALSATGEEEGLREGVELTHRELLGLLESHGITAVDPQGESFDPTHHEALLHEPVPGLTEGTVAEVFRKGYSYGERLLRPALVKVAKGEEAEEASDDTEAH